MAPLGTQAKCLHGHNRTGELIAAIGTCETTNYRRGNVRSRGVSGLATTVAAQSRVLTHKGHFVCAGPDTHWSHSPGCGRAFVADVLSGCSLVVGGRGAMMLREILTCHKDHITFGKFGKASLLPAIFLYLLSAALTVAFLIMSFCGLRSFCVTRRHFAGQKPQMVTPHPIDYRLNNACRRVSPASKKVCRPVLLPLQV